MLSLRHYMYEKEDQKQLEDIAVQKLHKYGKHTQTNGRQIYLINSRLQYTPHELI